MARCNDIIGQVACLSERLDIAHEAVVEHQRVEVVDARSLHGILHLVHIHPFAINPLVGHHASCQTLHLILSRHVVHGVET